MRQYAARHLEASGELAAVSMRHYAWYAELVTGADAAFWGAEHRDGIARLEAEYDNVRAALDWCVQGEEAAAGLA